MATPCIAQLRFEGEAFPKPVVATFDQEATSSDGGAVLLKALDGRLGVTATVARCLTDRRQAGKVQHGLAELVRQRVFGLACGYADCNDAARLADDPIHKFLVDRDPLTGPSLATQATLSRFENAVGPLELVRLGHALAELVVTSHRARLRGRARLITIDLDPTDDPTHGQQQFNFFNSQYDTWCYLPLLGTVTFNDEAEQHLVLALLRPGNSPAKLGAIGRLRRLFRTLRAAFPGARLRVRLDGGFAGEDILGFLEAEAVEYLVAVGSNARLEKRVRRLMGKARMRAKASGETAHVFGETRYAAKKWTHKRRVILKAEVVRLPGREPKDNPRFVVTNLPHTPAHVYQIYRARGDVENRIKELKADVALDRLSCSRFLANQFRLLLTAAAYILFQALRQRAAQTAWATAQVSTLREQVLKVAAWVERSVRRIVLHLPAAFPWRSQWQQLARALGATG
jgi:Transposase DDE domain group 1